ncbi:hypothetical protein [Paraburkholderia humisilvae]|uniref:hypothetical protein n=1 Tax=Paraburkholderia humisilvae TaxID=627669 RepID=UPI001C2E10C8|nr:hypothetical protein [Paraburkholderia humisilvae]
MHNVSHARAVRVKPKIARMNACRSIHDIAEHFNDLDVPHHDLPLAPYAVSQFGEDHVALPDDRGR